jgi:hypothetical protein
VPKYSELTKLRKDSEIQVSKGRSSHLGRRVDKIRSGKYKVCHDHWIWRRSVGVNSLTPSVFVSLVNFGIRHKGDGSSEVQSDEVNLGRRSEDAWELSQTSDLRCGQPDVDRFRRTRVL